MLKKLFKVLTASTILLTLTNTSANAVSNGETVTSWNGHTVSLHFTDTFKAAKAQGESNPVMKSQYCGATLITPQVAVTSAWCVTNIENHKFKETLKPSDIFVGADSALNSNTPLYTVKSIVVHPSYSPMSQLNDVAVITLENSVSSSKPVSLGENSAKTDAKVYGWGATLPNWENSGYGFGEDLQVGTIKVLPDLVCTGKQNMTLEGNRLFPSPSREVRRNISDFHCGVGVTDKEVDLYKSSQFISPCQGDEGAGIIDYTTNSLIAVSLHDLNCASPTPKLFTKTSAHSSFINQYL